MSVKLRLTRVGSKKNPIYRVVAADTRSPRDGKFIEIVGRYNPQSEPALIEQERSTLRAVLRLVAERADAESEVESTRATSDATTDQEYQKSRQVLEERFAELKEGSRRADEEGRRAIIDAARAGESEAKAVFAKASRRIAGDFETFRERTRSEHNRARAEITASFESGEKKAAFHSAGTVAALARMERVRKRPQRLVNPPSAMIAPPNQMNGASGLT